MQNLLKSKLSGPIPPLIPVLQLAHSEDLAGEPPPLLPASPTGAPPVVGLCATHLTTLRATPHGTLIEAHLGTLHLILHHVTQCTGLHPLPCLSPLEKGMIRRVAAAHPRL